MVRGTSAAWAMASANPARVIAIDRGTLRVGSAADLVLWNAEYAGHGLTRYAPDGRIDRHIELPVTNPTCCCFGGDNLDTLYVTSATQQTEAGGATEGALLALDVGVQGLPEAAFGG